MMRPGSIVGILGGGQLGRMLAMAAAHMGLKTHIYSPQEGPAWDVSTTQTLAPYEEEEALKNFAAKVDVITYEFENIPCVTAHILNTFCPVRPHAKILERTQDRFVEKAFLKSLKIPTAPFKGVELAADLEAAIAEFGYPVVLKTRRFGYDGRGQELIRTQHDAIRGWERLRGTPCIVEKFIPFQREISVIAARNLEGEFAAWDVVENRHESHILKTSSVPARIRGKTAQKALQITRDIANALQYVGVFAVEFFVEEEGGKEHLLVNEIAPRVHNSGHWTLDGACTSQFEQHIRAICGWPLGSCERIGQIEMHNLIGSEVETWLDVLHRPHAHLHLYGKQEIRQGRKMGHVTTVLKG